VEASKTGDSVMSSFGEGIEGFDLEDTFGDMFKDTGKYIEKDVGKDFEGFGEDLGFTFGEGFTGTEKKQKKEFGKLGENLAETLGDSFIKKGEDQARDFEELGETLAEYVGQGFEDGSRNLGRLIRNALDSAISHAKSALGAFIDLGKYLLDGVRSGINTKSGDLSSTLTNTVSSAVNSVLSNITSALTSLGQGITQGIADAITVGTMSYELVTAIKSALTYAQNDVTSSRGDAGAKARAIGGDIAESIVDGLWGAQTWFVQKIVEWIQESVDDAGEGVSGSPIPEAYAQGLMITDSIAAGILAGKSDVVSVMEDTLRSVGLAGRGGATFAAQYAGYVPNRRGDSGYKVLAPIILEGDEYKTPDGEYNWRAIAEVLAGEA